ncbi:MAG: hypothetical protein QM705_15450 [Ancrocorticia sp.]
MSRSPNDINLFVIDTKGNVCHAWWYPEQGWSCVGGQWQVLGRNAGAGAPIAAIARTPDHLDVFLTGTNGVVYTSNWASGRDWSSLTSHNNSWEPISQHFGANAPVTVVAYTPEDLHLFITGPDGKVYCSSWAEDAYWDDLWVPLGDQFAPGTPITAIGRDDSIIDLLAVDKNGKIVTNQWCMSEAWYSQRNGGKWLEIGSDAVPGTTVAVVARNPNHLDAIVTDRYGILRHTWWDPNPGWHSITQAGGAWNIIGGSLHASATLALTSRNADNMDAFCPGKDGHIYTASWKPGTGWSSIHPGVWVDVTIAPDSPTTPPQTEFPQLSRLDLFGVNVKGDIIAMDSRSGIHPGYSAIIDGDYGAGGQSILAYDPALGQGDVWTRPGNSGLMWSATNTTLPKGATLQAKAKLSGSRFSNQLFYYPSEGSIEIYEADTPGKLRLVRKQTGMRKTWTHLVQGNFNGDPYHALFFYDAAAGHGEFWVSDGQGNLSKSSEYSNLPQGHTFAVSANLFGKVGANDILLYNSATGNAIIFEVENCNISKGINTPLRPGFRHILAVAVSTTQWSDLLCYDPAKGEIVIYSTTGNAKLTQFASKAGFPTNWTAMTRGLFNGGPATHKRTHFAAYSKTMDTSLSIPQQPTPPPASAKEDPFKLDGAWTDRGDGLVTELKPTPLPTKHGTVSTAWDEFDVDNLNYPKMRHMEM